MKLSVDNIAASVLPLIQKLKTYAGFVLVVTFLSVYVYQVSHIGHLIQDEPSQAAINDKLKPVSQLKIDEDSIKKITELESQNVEVKALFEQARQNPFTEE